MTDQEVSLNILTSLCEHRKECHDRLNMISNAEEYRPIDGYAYSGNLRITVDCGPRCHFEIQGNILVLCGNRI